MNGNRSHLLSRSVVRMMLKKSPVDGKQRKQLFHPNGKKFTWNSRVKILQSESGKCLAGFYTGLLVVRFNRFVRAEEIFTGTEIRVFSHVSTRSAESAPFLSKEMVNCSTMSLSWLFCMSMRARSWSSL